MAQGRPIFAENASLASTPTQERSMFAAIIGTPSTNGAGNPIPTG